MKVREICDKLQWALICGDGEKTVDSCYIGDMLSRAMGACDEGQIWITVQTSNNMVAVATLGDVAAVLLPEGIVPPEDTVNCAQEREVTILGCRESAYEAAVKLAREIGVF